MSKHIAIVAVSLVFSIILSFFSSYRVFAKNCEDIRHDVVRLHILANSNSKRDQDLKLLVRDNILKLDGEIFKSAVSQKNAEEIITRELPKIKEIAQNTLYENGYFGNVDVQMTNMYFTTREYEKFTLPAGYYDALRVSIGEALGHNWWCVLYPPLCLPAASKEDALAVLGEDKTQLILGKEKYKFKFAIVEIVEKIKSKIVK